MSEQLKSINPYDGSLVGAVQTLELNQVGELVARSKKAQKKWKKLSLEERYQSVLPIGKELLEKENELAELMAKEMGKPIKSSLGEVRACGYLIEREGLDIVKALQPEVIEHEKFTETRFFDPLGVSLAITPWNFPMLMPVWQILPALISGNTVIFKPSEETPLIAQAFFEIAKKHLPEDVLLMAHGNGAVGAALVEADVDLITFTGSRNTGLRILKAAGLKRVILELGGKDPLLVLESADIEAAAKFAANNGFRNSGQVCVSTERIYVDKKIKDEFNKSLLKEVQSLNVGDALDEKTDMGPMINSKQKEIVVDHIKKAESSGAKVLTGGADGDGCFVQPTVLTDVNHKMAVMSEETFGPVVGVMEFNSIDEAIELANDSNYGLGAAIFGEKEEAAKIARELDSGMVGINKGVSGVPNSPWVGAKESGYGFHSSEHGHRQFCQVRVVTG